MARVHVTSEIGPLRTVLVHTPGRELVAVTPGNREDYLYDDIIDLDLAQREHRRFVAVLERFAQVYEVRTLLTELVARPDVREFLVTRALEVVPSDALAKQLAALSPEELVGLMVEGALEEAGPIARALNETGFALPPLPNLFFTRDVGIVIGEHSIIGSMRYGVRWTEELLVKALFRYHPCLENAGILEARVVAEQRLHEELLGPAHAIAHGSDDRVLADHDPHIPREEEVGERWQGETRLVERPGDGPGFFQGAFDHQPDQLFGRERGELLRQGVRRHHLEGAGHEEFAHVGTRHQLRQERAHLVHLGEPLQHRHEAPVLALGEVQVDDVVVEVVFPVAGRDCDQLATGGMDQDRSERADFACDVYARHGRNLTRNAEGGTRNSSESVASRTTFHGCSAFRVPTSAFQRMARPQPGPLLLHEVHPAVLVGDHRNGSVLVEPDPTREGARLGELDGVHDGQRSAVDDPHETQIHDPDVELGVIRAQRHAERALSDHNSVHGSARRDIHDSEHASFVRHVQ